MIATYACTHVESKAIADLPARRGWNEIFAHAKQLPGASHVGMFGEGEGDDSERHWVCFDYGPHHFCLGESPEGSRVTLNVDSSEYDRTLAEEVERHFAALLSPPQAL